MNGTTTTPRSFGIVFLCEHGAAKSIVASAWFNKLAEDQGLDVRSMARGTHPDPVLSSVAVAGLRSDGLQPVLSAPEELSSTDLVSTRRIVAFCELPAEIKQILPTESWGDVPAVSEGYAAARDAIIFRIHRLISELKASGLS